MLRALLAVAPSLALAVVEPELDPVRPIDPPDPTSYVAPRALPHPEPPPQMARIRADAFVEAIEEHADRPGETAFRTSVSAFLQHNRKFAEAQADREGLTIEEIEELTYLGLMVQESQRWGDVEELVGRAISDEERAQGETLMHDLNREFKATMRRMVSEGASTAERWRYIRETEARYRTAYFLLTGMNARLLDDLLAGDAMRAYAASMTPPIEDAPQDEPEVEIERPSLPPEPAERQGEADPAP